MYSSRCWFVVWAQGLTVLHRYQSHTVLITEMRYQLRLSAFLYYCLHCLCFILSDLCKDGRNASLFEYYDVFDSTLINSVFHITKVKLEKPKVTKRTYQNNPWITDSIITAIEKKHELRVLPIVHGSQ